jgi:hypothetical protein
MSTKKNDRPEAESQSRRNFLRAGLAGATVAGATAGAAIAPAQASESQSERRKQRYQETAHVKKFYQTNRY